MIPVEELGGLLDGFLQELVPALFAVLVEAAPAQVVLVLVFFQGWWPSSSPGQSARR